MRKPSLSAVIVLTLLVSATAVAWARNTKASVARYRPPAEPGLIYTVIDYARAGGTAQHTQVSVSWGQRQESRIVPAPYASNLCATSTPSGFVLRLRNNQGSTVPLILTTNGTIVRGPYQGEIPMELLQACYSLVL